MEMDDIREKAIEIDTAIRKNPWMDFEVEKYDHQELIVAGNLSPSYPNRPGRIEILFKDVFFISLPISWKTDTSEQVFSVMDGEDAISINKFFRVEQGYQLFKFKSEDHEESFGCLICAKKISYRIL